MCIEDIGMVRRAAIASLIAIDAYMTGDEILARLAEARRDEIEYFIRFLRDTVRKLSEHAPLDTAEIELVTVAHRSYGDHGTVAHGLRRLADILESILRGSTSINTDMLSTYRRMLHDFTTRLMDLELLCRAVGVSYA